MRNKFRLILILSLFLFFQVSCGKKQQSLNQIYREIRNTPQLKYPDRKSDKKLLAIEKLKITNDENTPDSLLGIFLSIDTSLAIYGEYQYKILDVLAHIDTEKSIRTYAKILTKYEIGYTGGHNSIIDHFKDTTKNTKYLFPETVDALYDIDLFEGAILAIMAKGYEWGTLTIDDLKSSKKGLLKYYDRLIVERDSLPGHKSTPSYYYHELPFLITCLKIYGNDSVINRLYYETLNDNIDFATFYDIPDSSCYFDYGYVNNGKLDIIYHSAIALLRNKQKVQQVYIDKILSDPMYRMFFYEQLKEIDPNNNIKSKFLSQYYIAEGDYVLTNEHDGTYFPICKLSFVEKRTLKEGEFKGNYYFFRVRSDEKSRWWLTCSGPQPLNENETVYHGNATNGYFKEISLDSLKNEVNLMFTKIKEDASF